MEQLTEKLVNSFVDGAYRKSETGQRFEVRDWRNQPVYAPSQTKIILLPYQQAAGWPELNQRFPQAPGISMILTPTTNADHFIQAAGLARLPQWL